MIDVEAAYLRKVRLRIIPMLFLGILIGYIDRANIAYAALQMNADLGLSATAYGWAAGLFFLGYFFFEIPGTIMLDRLGARIWMPLLIVCWGTIALFMPFVRGARSFYVLRFLLGLAEAGFFPGTILLMKLWVPAAQRARFGAYFMTAVPFAMVVSGPVSGLLLEWHGRFGLKGWQWIFLVEGLPCFGLATWMAIALPDAPAAASWLSVGEKGFIADRLAREELAKQVPAERARWRPLLNIRLLFLCLVAFGGPAVATGVTFWLPQVLAGFGLRPLATGFASALPFLVAGAALWWWGDHADRTGEQRWHLVLPLMAAAVGLVGVVAIAAPAAKFVMLLIASLGMFSYLPVLWAASHGLFRGSSAPVGYGVISMAGALAGLTAPALLGMLQQRTGSHDAGVLALAGIAVLAAVAGYAFGNGEADPDADIAKRPHGWRLQHGCDRP